MKTNHKIKNMLLCTALLIGITATNASAKQNKAEVILTLAFSENGKPRALDLYWHRMAECETGGNWKDKGTWSGGLGIYKQTWSGYGGKQFAPKPELATIDEQIIIANRISTQGYQTKNEFRTFEDRQQNKPFFREPVGFGGWGCKKNVGNPVLFKKFPVSTLLREYHLGERSNYVFGIQKIIGVRFVDGYFGPYTDASYNKFMSKYRKYLIAEYEKYK
jgi:hypothetical protein